MNDVTYGALDKALRSLGFTCRVLRDEPAARWYEHPDTGAIISLPLLPDDDQVLPRHLATVQATLKMYGMANPLELAAESQKAS